MENENIFKHSVEKTQSDPSVEEKRQRVISKYGPLFKLENIQNLDIEMFSQFFNFGENEHWTGINQNMPLLVSDPLKLKKALSELLDESKPIKGRIDKVTGQNGTPMVKGLGPARISAILQVAYPEKYGVYNTVSMNGLSKIDMNPADSKQSWRRMTLGEKYTQVNNKLVTLSKNYKITLWALDWVWFDILKYKDELEKYESGRVSQSDTFNKQEQESNAYIFSLESHLEDFLVQNWDNTILSKDAGLEIVLDEETGETIGRQYRTDVGRIDLLCHNKKTGDYTIIELKRNQTSDETIGQLLRYMSWTEEKLTKGKPTKGIIIAAESDTHLHYALKKIPDAELYLYKVDFKLTKKER